LGSAWRSLGEYKKAIDYFTQALAIDKKAYGDQHPAVARDLNNLGLAWYSLGEYKKAIDYFTQALAIIEIKLPPSHPHIKLLKNNINSAKAESY
ncbi:MAG: tetratricopeptide repeat protein, partial [Desulfobacteraceae bacterium]|nr:tetratricopeptide repeat protein [Desulfobacteraceae bacterium]